MFLDKAFETIREKRWEQDLNVLTNLTANRQNATKKIATPFPAGFG